MTVISNVFIVLGIIFNYDANGVSDFNVRVSLAISLVIFNVLFEIELA